MDPDSPPLLWRKMVVHWQQRAGVETPPDLEQSQEAAPGNKYEIGRDYQNTVCNLMHGRFLVTAYGHNNR